MEKLGANPRFFLLLLSLLAIVENGVKLRLNIVDTPGYGDQVNNENWYGTFFFIRFTFFSFSTMNGKT